MLRTKRRREVVPDPGLRIRTIVPKPQVKHRSGFDRPKLGDISDRRASSIWGSCVHFADFNSRAGDPQSRKLNLKHDARRTATLCKVGHIAKQSFVFWPDKGVIGISHSHNPLPS